MNKARAERRAARRAIRRSIADARIRRRRAAFWRQVGRIFSEAMIPKAEIPADVRAFAARLGIAPDAYVDARHV